MPTFLWAAKDRFGQSVAREVTADTVEQAKESLQYQGYTDLVLKGDEVYDESQKSFGDDPRVFGERVVVTPEQKLKFREQPPPTFAGALFAGVREAKMLVAVEILAIAWLIYRERYVAAALVVAVAVGWFVFRVWINVPGIYYNKLIKAREWRRWNEVLTLVGRCERMNRRHVIKIPETELANSRAKALTGLGKLEEGIAELRRFENRAGMPTWLFKTNVAALYDIVKQHDAAIENMRQAITEKPTPTLYVDLAHRLLWRKGDLSAGGAALAEAEKRILPDLALPFVHRCRGLLATLQGNHQAARHEFESAIAYWLAHPNQPFLDANLSLTRGFLACVLVRQGEMTAARKMFSQAEEYLVVVDETELLQECRNLLGVVCVRGMIAQ